MYYCWGGGREKAAYHTRVCAILRLFHNALKKFY